MRLGVLGGTFDPPHIGHLVMADAAMQQLDLPKVSWLPTGDPWQKDRVTPAHDRLQMTRLAVDGVGDMVVDDREVVRAGPTYTVETLDSLRAEGVEPVLIMGADTAAGIPGWHRSAELGEVEIAVAPRPGTPREVVEAAVVGPISWIDTPPLDLSATDLRRRLTEGLSTRFLIPERVSAYARSRGLYD